jgi:hypothetical protein
MKRIGMRGLLLSGLLLAAPAEAKTIAGPWPVSDPTSVVVLGTPHLSGIDTLKPEWLQPLLDRLAAWHPQVITIEGLSGPECHLLRVYEKNWPGTADDYCKRVESVAALAAKSTGLDMPAAEAEAEKQVEGLGPSPTPGARRRLAAIFAAAGNLGSATVQWLRLPVAERREGDGVDGPVKAALDDLTVRRNENYLVAAALAARLGLDRVYPVDDHLSDRIMDGAPAGFEQTIPKLWNSGPKPQSRITADAMEKGLKGGATVLAYYRFLNLPKTGEEAVASDMGRAFRDSSPQKHGQRYVAGWQARNLHMVANIETAIGHRPGERALVIVGATHKPYFEAYLGMMHEVRLVPTAQVLGK